MAIFGIFLFGVVFNISRWFELEIIEIPDPDKNDTILILKVLLFPLLSKEVHGPPTKFTQTCKQAASVYREATWP